jgi:hypothetical protein
MCNSHPKFDEALLPNDLGIHYTYHNQGGARKLVLAHIHRITGAAVGRLDIATGHAICSPQDKFDAERGRAIATGRAVKAWWMQEHVPEGRSAFPRFSHAGMSI